MRRAALVALAAAALSACGKTESKRGPGLYALLDTDLGTIVVRLRKDKAPRSVAHFVGLATGKTAWTHPATGKTVRQPIYNGVVFHRVVPKFMIQTGDPLGTGEGRIGIKLRDEFSDLRYDAAGKVGLANDGPNTNHSQIFITLGPAPQLEGYHPIFGEVVEGLEIAREISKAPRETRDGSDRPFRPVRLNTVRIVEER